MPQLDIDTNNIVAGTFPDEGGVAYISFADEPTLPKTASEEIAKDVFDSLGDLSPDGFTEITDLSSNDFDDCCGRIVLTVDNTKKRKVKLKFIEAMREAVLKFVYGVDAVSATGGVPESVTLDSKPTKERPIVIEQLWTNGWKVRYVLDRFKITSFDEIPHNRQNLLGFGLEGTLLDNDGVLGHIYFAKPDVAAGNEEASALSSDAPSDSWTKERLLEWCAANGVTADESMTKAQILDAISQSA